MAIESECKLIKDHCRKCLLRSGRCTSPFRLHYQPSELSKSIARQSFLFVVKQCIVNEDDGVSQKIVLNMNSSRGTHFRRAEPRQKVYFESDEVHPAIVNCWGLCPGLNTVIREIVCGLHGQRFPQVWVEAVFAVPDRDS